MPADHLPEGPGSGRPRWAAAASRVAACREPRAWSSEGLTQARSLLRAELLPNESDSPVWTPDSQSHGSLARGLAVPSVARLRWREVPGVWGVAPLPGQISLE